jgi:hypothetical protein
MSRDPSGPTHKYPIQIIYCSAIRSCGTKERKSSGSLLFRGIVYKYKHDNEKKWIKEEFWASLALTRSPVVLEETPLH